MNFTEFLDKLTRFGMETFRRFYGPYRAIVMDNKDPLFKGRVKVQCPRASLPGDNDMWVLPMMQGAGKNRGMFWPPEIGDAVWMFFDNGDVQHPAGYLGGWYGAEELAEDLSPDSSNSPKKRGFISPGGSKIIIDDTDGSEQITIEHPGGKVLKITKDKVSIGSKSGPYEPMMKGSTVKAYLQTHTHVTPWGPSAPPTEPFPTNGLSDDTETT